MRLRTPALTTGRLTAARLTAARLTAALLALLAPTTTACSEHAATGATRASTTTAGALPLARYFPLARGDRWRTRGGSDGTIPRVFGVTGVDATGVAVVFGGAGPTPERFRVTATEIARVDDHGRALVPLLRAPIEEGAAWSYTLAERGVSIPCEARVLRIDRAPRTLRGVSLAGCATVERACHYPIGAPFPIATTHTQDETYCPDVGVVEQQQRFSPPPARGLIPIQTTERLVAWNVAGGPVPAPGAHLDCDAVLLLPSDVQAACGAGLMAGDEPTGVLEGGECVLRYAGGGRTVEVRVAPPPTAAAPTSAVPAAPGAARLRVETPRAVVTIDGCDDSRLVPLLRSLFP